MDTDISQKILKNHHLRVTDSRKQVLDVFINKKFAISHSFLEQELKQSHDRVTIYRNLHSFLENGIIHKVLDEGGSTKYALCSTCTDHHHTHDHVHFKCEICSETICLNQLSITFPSLPDGFKAREIGILIQGICNKCN